MAYFDKFEPAQLPPDATTLRSQLTAGMLFHARQLPSSSSTARLLTTYMVTTDKAAREYIAGCRRIRDHMNAAGGIQAIFEGVGHFENCINSAKRALRALERMGARRDGPAFDRTIRKLAHSHSDPITSLRDAIEHIDERIASDGGIPENAAHLLAVARQGDHLEIGSERLSFGDLHRALSGLHSAGVAIINSLPTLTAASPAE